MGHITVQPAAADAVHDSRYLAATPLLDFEHQDLRALVERRGWSDRPASERVGAAYEFVHNEIAFGYNVADALPASRVLADGLGQCNTKTILLMALLRGTGLPCRFHGATIDKALQKGVMKGIFYRIAPAEIVHSWAEVYFDGRWVALEGVILDDAYLAGVRARVHESGTFLGLAVGTDNLADPPVAWRGVDTAIQRTGVHRDFGVYDDPDTFYREHPGNVRGVKGVLFRLWMRRSMNREVVAIRRSHREEHG
jgi:transglutaminase-like putative cysteine protease